MEASAGRQSGGGRRGTGELDADAFRIELRPAAAADRDTLCRIYAATRTEELAHVPWTAEQKQAFLRSQFEAQDAHYREHYAGADFDVVLLDGVVVGRLYVARWKDEIRIMDIALLPEHRGRGIGGRLLRDLLDEAGRTGRKTSIHVEMNNPARTLYERLGFEPAGEHGVYVRMERSPA